MLKTSSKTHLLSIAVFASLVLLPMGARADGDGGGGHEDYRIPAANYVGPKHEASVSENVTCAEATKAAWFNRQLQMTDGDVSPEFDTPRECQREIFATADQATE